MAFESTQPEKVLYVNCVENVLAVVGFNVATRGWRNLVVFRRWSIEMGPSRILYGQGMTGGGCLNLIGPLDFQAYIRLLREGRTLKKSAIFFQTSSFLFFFCNEPYVPTKASLLILFLVVRYKFYGQGQCPQKLRPS